MKRPAELFVPSQRPMLRTLPELAYPMHDDVVPVTRSGQIYIASVGTVTLGAALAGHHVGIREEEDGRWLVSFASLDLGHVDLQGKLTPMNAS